MSSIEINPRDLRATLLISGILSIVMLFLTLAVHTLYDNNRVTDELWLYVLSLFNLSSENTIASWFSSVLLCLTGLLAALCFCVDASGVSEKRSVIFSRGWVFISIVFMLMSLDEMGSVHENLGALSILDAGGDRSWQSVIAAPLLLIFTYMMVFAWKFLRNQYATLALFAVGAMFFLSVPLQEHLEMKMWAISNYSPDWKRPIAFVLLEEGSELLATLCFFSAMMCYVMNKKKDEKTFRFDISPLTNFRSLASILSMAMILCLCFYQFGPLLTADEGIAVNWFPSVMNLCLIVVIRLRMGKPLPWYSTASLLMISIIYAINFYMLLDWDVIFYLRMVVTAIILPGLSNIVLHFVASQESRVIKVAAMLWIISVVFALLVPSSLVAVFGFVGSAVIFGALSIHVQRAVAL